MIHPVLPEDLPHATRAAADLRARIAGQVLHDEQLEEAARSAALLRRAREQARRDVSVPAWAWLFVATVFLAGIFIGKWLPWGFALQP